MSFNNGLYDTMTENYILGAILKDPSLLHEDKYPLNPYDFNNRRNRIIFGAALEMANQGVETITPQDIDSYLMRFPEQYRIFNENDGIQILAVLTENVNTDKSLYGMHYERLQKFSVLRDLESAGINTKQFYDPDKLFSDSNSDFEELTAQSIIDKVKEQLNDVEEKHENKKNKVGIKAAQGIMDLIQKFKVTPEIGEHLDGEIYNYAVRGARYGKFYLTSAPSGHGKALPNSTRIPTPKGWRKVKDIRVGDFLFDSFGKPTQVLGVYPQGKKEVWQITLSDGRTARCCNEHLWSYNHADDKPYENLITKELKDIELYDENGKALCYLPNYAAVEYKAKEHTIEPYEFGRRLRKIIDNSDLEYVIPREYIEDSIENRIDFCRGFFFGENGVNIVSKTLKNNLLEILMSLGHAIDFYSDVWNVFVKGSRPAIAKIESLGYVEEMTCFTVNNPYHLFLTENFIPTHNTRHMVGQACNLAFPRIDEMGNIVTRDEYFPVLFIPTEQDEEEIQTLILSYISGVNEKKIITGSYNEQEEQRLMTAAKIMEAYSDNFFIETMPDPTIGLVKTKVLKYIYKYDIHYVFYDYIFSSPGLLGEFRDLKIREDERLLRLNTPFLLISRV